MLFSVALLLAVLFFVGLSMFGGGLTPSALVRARTPPGQSGEVFGFVSTGYNIGGIIAPPILGWIIDHSSAGMTFWAVGLFALLSVLTVLLTGQSTRNRSHPDSRAHDQR